MKTQRTEEFSEYINNLKMYNDLHENGVADKHSQLLKQVQDKGLIELTIANTFMNTQNNDNIEKT